MGASLSDITGVVTYQARILEQHMQLDLENSYTIDALVWQLLHLAVDRPRGAPIPGFHCPTVKLKRYYSPMPNQDR